MLDGTGMSSPNLTSTCMVGMAPRLEYITWKDVLKQGEGKKIKEKDWNSCTILLFNKTI